MNCARWSRKVLADNAGTDLTPRNIAHTLNRSSGAVGNACKVLADRGEAEVASTAPLTYRATATTASAAASTITPAPPRTPRPTDAHTARRRRPPRPPVPPVPRRVAPPPRSARVVTGPVKRPNGMDYHPRMLAGMPDVTALRRFRDAGVAALLYGPPGTGKTSVVEAAFPDLLTVQGDGDTTVADFVGEYTQTDDGRYVFVHGPLVRAMREGVPLFIDDATLIPPTVLAVVYPAMDGRRQIVIKANGGEVVDAAPGFYVVAGHNPGVHGAVLSDALSSRFSAQIHVATDYDLAAQLKIDRRAVQGRPQPRHPAGQGRDRVGTATAGTDRVPEDRGRGRGGSRRREPRGHRAGRGPRDRRRHRARPCSAPPWHPWHSVPASDPTRPATDHPRPTTPPPSRKDTPAMTTHLVADPDATGAAVFPARPEWLTLSAALTDEVDVIADREDLLVTIAPGAGGGAPACFLPRPRADRGRRHPPRGGPRHRGPREPRRPRPLRHHVGTAHPRVRARQTHRLGPTRRTPARRGRGRHAAGRAAHGSRTGPPPPRRPALAARVGHQPDPRRHRRRPTPPARRR